MIPISILEDDARQRSKLTDIIDKYLMINNIDSQIVLSTDNPKKLIEFIERHIETYEIIFLDIEISGSSLNGIDIAEQIRSINTKSKIIFISSHDELGLEIFNKNIEAFDFIVKNDYNSLQERVIFVLKKLLVEQIPETKTKDIIKLNFNDEVRFISVQDIQFFCTIPGSPHKLEAHPSNSQFQFYDKLKKLVLLNENFFQCHKAYIVNIKNIMSIDKKNRTIVLSNGEKIPISKNKMCHLV